LASATIFSTSVKSTSGHFDLTDPLPLNVALYAFSMASWISRCDTCRPQPVTPQVMKSEACSGVRPKRLQALAAVRSQA
jgi:hypothetical protein